MSTRVVSCLRLVSALALLCGAFAPALHAAIAMDAVSQHVAPSSTRSVSWTHTLGAGTDRVVVVGVASDDLILGNDDVSGVTFAGVPMQRVPGTSAAAPGLLVMRTQLFYLLESHLPPAGGYTVTATFRGTVRSAGGAAISLAGVAQQPPAAGAAAIRPVGILPITTRIAAPSPGWTVDLVASDSSAAFVPGAGQVRRFSAFRNRLGIAGSAQPAAVSGLSTLTWAQKGLARTAASTVAFAAAPPPPPPPVEYTLAVATEGNGAVTRAPTGDTHPAGTVVTLTAQPAVGWQFAGWSGALTGSENPAAITLNADTAITASFAPIVHTLTTSSTGPGTITLDPPGTTFAHGTIVALHAVPSTGARFTGWSGALTGADNPASLTIEGDASVAAHFIATHTVATAMVGEGAIVLDPLSDRYDAGSIVGAVAIAAEGWEFSGWSGDLTGGDAVGVLTIDGDKSITATFIETPATAGIEFDAVSTGSAVAASTVTWSHTLGAGAQRALVVGLAVEDNSAAEMTVTSVTFNGVPLSAVAGSKISGGNSSNRDQSELFLLLESGLPDAGTYDIVVTFAGPVDGVVGGGISLRGVKQAAPEAVLARSDTSGADSIASTITTLTPGAWVVDVVASGNTGAFTATGADQLQRYGLSAAAATSGLAGAGSTRPAPAPGPVTLAWDHVNANRLMHSLVALAPAADVPPPAYALVISTTGDGLVSVDPVLPEYPAGTDVMLTAVPGDGQVFAGWSGDLAGTTNPAVLTMNAPRSVTATFAPVGPTLYTLTVNIAGNGSVLRAPDQASYAPGTIVDLVAQPALGWVFSGWSGDLAGAATPNVITMDGDKTVTATFTPEPGGTPDFGLYGWATQGAGTTGGAGGTEVVVNTLEDFKFYASQAAPYIIKISGTIFGNEVVRVRSNKSILGIGADARFLGIGLQIGWNSEFGQIGNVILRNITFEKAIAPIDCVQVTYGAKNVWIDHCDFFSERTGNIDFYDGLLDITHGADFVTVSWCRFYEHYKTSLVGHSENNAAEDAGHLTVTYHHNSFIDSGGRNPSVRFGTVHVYNNYYLDLDDYAIASRQNAEVLIENNYFENVNRPIRADTSLSPVAGRVRGVETNIFVNCTPNSITSEPATWVPPYPYALTPAADVPALVTAWAGVGIVTFDGTPPPPPPPIITGQPASQAVAVGATVQFSVTAIGAGPFTYQWFKDGEPITGAESATLELVGVQAGDSGAYWVVVTNASGPSTSGVATLTVGDEPPPPPPPGGGAVLLRERFADGTRGTQTLPDSAAWFASSGSGSFTATTGAATMNMSSSRTMLAYFTDDSGAPVNVAPGQTLTLDMVVQFTGSDPTGNMNLGLLRSVANPDATSGTGFVPNGPPNTNARVTGDFGSGAPASAVFSLYQGYAMFGTASASTASNTLRLFARTGANTNILSSTSPFTQITATGTTSPGLLAGIDYRLTLTLHHGEAGMEIAFDLTQVADDAVVMSVSGTDAAATFTAFDTLVLYKASGGATELVIKAADVDLISPVVAVPPSILTHPASATVSAGGTAVFSVEVAGTAPFTYQWRRDGVEIPGAEGPTLVLDEVQPADAGDYSVFVGNIAGEDISDPATLTVTVPPAVLLRERFADGDRTAQALPDSAAWFTSAGSSNLTATAGEATLSMSSSRTLLAHFTDDTGTPVNVGVGQTLTWDFVFQFTGADPTGNMNFGILRSVANPDATSGTGFVPNGPPNTEARVTGDFGSGAPASGVFSLYTGYTAFGTSGASSTPFRLYARTGVNTNILSTTAPLTQITGPAFTPSTALAAGIDYRARFSLENTGAGMALSFSIRRVSDDGLTVAYAAIDAGTTFTSFDTIVFYKASGGATSLLIKEADVTLAGAPAGDPPVITSSPVSQSVLAGEPVIFSVVAEGTMPLAYQWQRNGIDIPGAEAPTFALVAAQPVDAGGYRARVTNAAGSATSGTAVLTVETGPSAPVITTQPASTIAITGGAAAFSVIATGTAPLAYQWYKDGELIDGAGGATLAITDAQEADEGAYTVVVSNTLGDATSLPALLTVADTLPLASYDLAGFGAAATGGGIIPETDPNYLKVYTPDDLRAALQSKTAKVIEIMNDLDMGYLEIPVSARTGPIRNGPAPKLHPVLLASGVSIIDIQDKDGLTIFSAHGATIRHAIFNIKRVNNLIVRNLRFDELWEWDESSKGRYDSLDWDFMRIDMESDHVWIDHCTFTKCYDGVLDVKGGARNITISWCEFLGDDGGPGSFVRQQIEALEQNPGAYPMYGFLRSAGFGVEDIIAIVRSQKKGHLVGSNEFAADNANFRVTLHNNLYRNLQDRLPRLRGGNAHVFNVVLDNTEALAAKDLRNAIVAAMTPAQRSTLGGYSFDVTLNGAISTEGGAVLIEKSALHDVLFPLRNNQVSAANAAYTGKILALDVIYTLDELLYRGDSDVPGSPLAPVPAAEIPFSWNGFATLPYNYTVRDPSGLEAILAGPSGAGAGKLAWPKAHWLATSY